MTLWSGWEHKRPVFRHQSCSRSSSCLASDASLHKIRLGNNNNNNNNNNQIISKIPPNIEKSESRSVVSDSLWPHELQPARLLSPWNSPGKNTRVGCQSLLQGIFLTQESNSGLLLCRQILYPLSYQRSLSIQKLSYIQFFTESQIHVCIYKYMYINICMYIYAYTHTHKESKQLAEN